VEPECYPSSILPHTSQLFLDYTESTEPLTPFFSIAPTSKRWISEGRKLSAEHRARLADLLALQNAEFNGGPAATANIELLTCTEIVGLSGNEQGQLERVRWRSRTGAEVEKTIRNVFMFIGAEPNTAWLDGGLALDNKGYIMTGLNPGEAVAPVPFTLQTSLPRVFAIGDIRCGSTKRVAAGVGEGAAVVSQIHRALAVLQGDRA